MSSRSRPDAGQAALPFEVETTARRTPAGRRVAERSVLHRLETGACGWPAGTELLVTPRRRLARGDLAVVEEGGRRLVGSYHVRFGRPFVIADREAIWVGPGVRVVGVVTVVSPPLPGPDSRPTPPAARGAGGRTS